MLYNISTWFYQTDITVKHNIYSCLADFQQLEFLLKIVPMLLSESTRA